MNSMITLRFFNGMESAMIDGTEISSWQPVGSCLIEILNADFADIAKRITDCKTVISNESRIYPLLATTMWNPDKISAIQESFLVTYPNMFSFFSTTNNWINDITLEFCGTTGNGDLMSVHDITAFRAFIDDLQSSPDFFTFEFLDYLNTIEAIPPFQAVACSVHRDHHKVGSQQLGSVTLDDLYSIFINGPSKQGKEYWYDFPSFSIIGMVMVCSLLEVARQGKIIRKCQNCGKYFIPAKRSDTLYCDNPSPDAPEMSCKEYGTRRLWYERQKEDELAKLSRNIASAKAMLAKRNPDIPQYADSYNYFKAQRLIWIKDIKDGRKTQDEYREWLLYMQSQKRIKEAIHGID